MKIRTKIDSTGLPIIGEIQQINLKKFSGRWASLSIDEEETYGARSYFEGCLVRLFVFYHGRNWKDHKVCEQVREDIKLHFNGETRVNLITGKAQRYAKSSKGKAILNELTQQLTEYLIENYGAPFESYDTESYKAWDAAVRPYDEEQDYITYLLTNEVLNLP